MAGFLTGLGLGVACAFLFAPYSGAETKALLSRKARKAGRYVEGQIREVRNSAEELLELGKDEVARQKEGLKDAFEAGSKAYKKAVG
jgi:gas vesicle protein